MYERLSHQCQTLIFVLNSSLMNKNTRRYGLKKKKKKSGILHKGLKLPLLHLGGKNKLDSKYFLVDFKCFKPLLYKKISYWKNDPS